LPTINSAAQPAQAAVGGSIADMATISGGFNPTGTVTFNLYNNATATGPALFTDTESVSGNIGTIAASPTGATESGNTVTITTTSATGIATGDSVTITGLKYPDFDGTFTVTGTPSTTSFTFTDAVTGLPGTGGGTVSKTSSIFTATSAGYTPTSTGTDYWVATYNGDTNNASAGTSDAADPVAIKTAQPTIASAAQPANAAVGTAIADKATISGGDSPSGTVTFDLYSNDTATGTPLYTDTENLSGGTATSANYTPTAAG